MTDKTIYEKAREALFAPSKRGYDSLAIIEAEFTLAMAAIDAGEKADTLLADLKAALDDAREDAILQIEKKEQELTELLWCVWCQFSSPVDGSEPASRGGVWSHGGLSILEVVSEQLLALGVLERVRPDKDWYRMIKNPYPYP